MKKNTKLSGLYLGIVFFLMYLPVAVVIIFPLTSPGFLCGLRDFPLNGIRSF